MLMQKLHHIETMMRGKINGIAFDAAFRLVVLLHEPLSHVAMIIFTIMASIMECLPSPPHSSVKSTR